MPTTVGTLNLFSTKISAQVLKVTYFPQTNKHKFLITYPS